MDVHFVIFVQACSFMAPAAGKESEDPPPEYVCHALLLFTKRSEETNSYASTES